MGNETMPLEELLLEANAIELGSFTLASGKKSNYYVNIKKVATDPSALGRIAEELSGKIAAGRIAGVELGAVPFLIATALKLGIPFIIVRKERSGESPHGIGSAFIGEVPRGEAVDIIEDVTTTGKSVLMAAELLKSNGAKVSRVISIMDREEGARELLHENGIELIALVKASELRGRK